MRRVSLSFYRGQTNFTVRTYQVLCVAGTLRTGTSTVPLSVTCFEENVLVRTDCNMS